MRHHDPRPARLALTLLKVAVVVALVAVGLTSVSASGQRGEAGRLVLDRPTLPSRLMERHDCSTTGFGPGVEPLSALVRRPGGRLRVVSFDRGWRIYTRHGAATLIAVCRRGPG